ncbi:hypothetical protein ACWGFX_06515 [Streptomyces xanthophaeus]
MKDPFGCEAPALLAGSGAADRSAARHAVAARAVDAEDLMLLLDMFGLLPGGARRHGALQILWMPTEAEAQEETSTAGYTLLKEYLLDVHVHLTARRQDQLECQRLVALAG